MFKPSFHFGICLKTKPTFHRTICPYEFRFAHSTENPTKNTPDAIPNRMCLSIWNAKATYEGAELTPDFFVPKKRVLRKSETRVNEGNNLRQRSEANDLPERQQNSRNRSVRNRIL